MEPQPFLYRVTQKWCKFKHLKIQQWVIRPIGFCPIKNGNKLYIIASYNKLNNKIVK